jgi:hypothetical protein
MRHFLPPSGLASCPEAGSSIRIYAILLPR